MWKKMKNTLFRISWTKWESDNFCDKKHNILDVNLLFPANTNHLYSICATSAQRFRRWSNIVQIVYNFFVFTVMPE